MTEHFIYPHIMPEHFDFPQLNLIPKKCIVNSRSECTTTQSLGSKTFKLPIVPANMECVINEDIAELLASNGYFYILHRFNVDVIAFGQRMKAANLPISISVGIGQESYDQIRALADAGIIPDYITIDIAHGHAQRMMDMLHWLKDTFSSTTRPFLIAGNVSTPEAVRDLEAWGADAIKVGIGPGSACTTYTATGFGSRGIQASVIRTCAAAANKSVIIADGGIKEPGEIAKALAMGAKWVMVGGMFSGLTDSPGSIVRDAEGRRYKEFWGSASAHQSGKTNRIEGTKKLMPLKERSYLEEMTYLTECLQSSISYAGGRTLEKLWEVQYIVRQA